MWTERVWLTCPPADRCLGYSHGLVVTNNVNCEHMDVVLGLSVCTGPGLPGTGGGALPNWFPTSPLRLTVPATMYGVPVWPRP